MLITLCSCSGEAFLPVYSPVVPPLPPVWTEILGEAHWRLEKVENGSLKTVYFGKADLLPDLLFEGEWTVPILAWPFWPEKGIGPGIARPAGALFPWDVSGAKIMLGWEGGVDAFLWLEMAKNYLPGQNSGTPRYPWFFDWPRFRELMKSEDIMADVRNDPWIADWEFFALRTAESGFDRRRIRAADKKDLLIPVLPSIWIGSSPFAAPVASSLNHIVLPSGEKAETWFSSLGILKVQNESWFFIPWDAR